MSNFYYTPNPDVHHDKIEWSFELLSTTLRFVTDNGVFSKKRVDYGSCALIRNFTTEGLPAGNFLDLGCGYGPVGLFLAKQNPKRQVEMVDVNNLSLSLAKENAGLNGIKNVDVHNSDVYKDTKGDYAAIITNPPVRAGKKIVDEMIEGSVNHLKDGGTLTLVLQKKQGAPSARKLMGKTFGNVEIVNRDKGYYVLRSKKSI